MVFKVHPFDLHSWQRSFFEGERLLAEVDLFASALLGSTSPHQLIEGCALLHASHGVSSSAPSLSPFQRYQESFPEPVNSADSRAQYLFAADCPDALLLWALIRHLPTTGEIGGVRRLQILTRTAQLVMQRFPKRPDLPYQLLLLEPTGSLLKTAPKVLLPPSNWYSNAQ